MFKNIFKKVVTPEESEYAQLETEPLIPAHKKAELIKPIITPNYQSPPLVEKPKTPPSITPAPRKIYPIPFVPNDALKNCIVQLKHQKKVNSHYEQEIASLKAKIQDLEAEKKKIGEELENVSWMQARFFDRIVKAEERLCDLELQGRKKRAIAVAQEKEKEKEKESECFF